MLYLVRHGRTEANAKGLLQGRIDLPLDAVGQKQAEAIAKMVGPIDEVIASPLLRAQETASYFGLPVATEERWTEISYGEFEGVAMGDVPSEVWTSWRTDPEYAPANGESFGALDRRVREVLDETAERFTSRDVVVVSHVSPIKSATAWALNATMDIMFHCFLSEASLCRIDVGRFGPTLHSFNEQAPGG